jgi:ssDNA-binding replication factor A large subunit
MRKRIADLELTSIYVADKVDSVPTRTHTFWKNENDTDNGIVDNDDVLNTAFISDDEDDDYNDVPDLIECSSDSDSDDMYAHLVY